MINDDDKKRDELDGPFDAGGEDPKPQVNEPEKSGQEIDSDDDSCLLVPPDTSKKDAQRQEKPAEDTSGEDKRPPQQKHVEPTPAPQPESEESSDIAEDTASDDQEPPEEVEGDSDNPTKPESDDRSESELLEEQQGSENPIEDTQDEEDNESVCDSIDDSRFIPRSKIHQLGALAFIGALLYIAFLPRWDFKDMVGLSTPQAIERGDIVLHRKGYIPEEYTLKSIELEKIVGFTALSFMDRYCDGRTMERIRSLGIPMSLYRLEYKKDGHRDIRMWLDPRTGALFTLTFHPPPGLGDRRDEFYQELIRWRRMAISDSLAENIGINDIAGDSGGIVDSLLAVFSKDKGIPLPESIDRSEVATEDEAVMMTDTELLRSGISVDEFEVKSVLRGDLLYDWRVIRSSDDLCSGMRVVLTSYLIGGHIYNDKPDVYLPEAWLLERDVWQIIRWGGLILFALFAGFLVIREFIKKFFTGNLEQPFLKVILGTILLVELLGGVNEFITHNLPLEAFTRFFLRTVFFSSGAILSWIALDDRVKRFPQDRCTSLRIKRDGIIIGLLGVLALMGLHNFLLWVGTKTGFAIGSSFLLGDRIFSGLPKYSGFLPAIYSLRKGLELLTFPFVFLFALAGILYSRYGRGRYLMAASMVAIALLTFIEGSTPLIYGILLIGNIILGLFAFTLASYYFKDNIYSYSTAILFYVFITDGYHLIKGSLAPFFAFNGLALFVMGLLPVFIALHISFFTPLREKFEEPIEEITPDDDWKLTT